MLIVNKSRFENDHIVEIAEFCERALGANLSDCGIVFQDYRWSYRGRAHSVRPQRSHTAKAGLRYHIAVHIGADHHFVDREQPLTNDHTRYRMLPAGTTHAQAEARLAKVDPRYAPRLRRVWHHPPGRRQSGIPGFYWADQRGPEQRYQIVTSVPYGGKTSPRMEYHSAEEALVAVTAHEMMHIVQFQHGWYPHEPECERAALVVLGLWRDRELAIVTG